MKNHTSSWTAETVSPALISFWVTVAYIIFRAALKLMAGRRIKVSPDLAIKDNGEENYIIAVNHQGRLDPFLATAALPWPDFRKLLPIRYMTKDAYVAHLWQKIFLFPLGCFPAKFSGEKTGLDLATEFLAKGQTIFIFPEGKIIKDLATSQAKVGVAYLALKNHATVIPILLRWPSSEKQTNKIGLAAYVGAPIQPAGNVENLQPVADKILDQIYALDKR